VADLFVSGFRQYEFMGYEIYIWPKDDKQTTPLDSFVDAFNTAGLSVTVQPDQFGHWLIFGGHESALNLEVKDGIVKGGGMQFSAAEDPSLLDRVVGVLRGLDWAAGDDEGELE
jgi:hypothetical protein